MYISPILIRYISLDDGLSPRLSSRSSIFLRAGELCRDLSLLGLLLMLYRFFQYLRLDSIRIIDSSPTEACLDLHNALLFFVRFGIAKDTVHFLQCLAGKYLG